MFIYMPDRQKYGKLMNQMENDLVLRNDRFPQMVPDACRVLVGWKNKYISRDNKITHANDGVAFATAGEEYNKRTKQTKKGK